MISSCMALWISSVCGRCSVIQRMRVGPERNDGQCVGSHSPSTAYHSTNRSHLVARFSSNRITSSFGSRYPFAYPYVTKAARFRVLAKE